LLDLLMRQDSGNYRVADVGSGAARRGSTPRHHMASTLSLPPAAEPLRASQRDLAACGQLPRAPRGSNQRRRLRREPVL